MLNFSGLFELEPGTIVFARPLREDGIYKEEDDIVEGWCLDGYVSSLISLLTHTDSFQTQLSHSR